MSRSCRKALRFGLNYPLPVFRLTNNVFFIFIYGCFLLISCSVTVDNVLVSG